MSKYHPFAACPKCKQLKLVVEIIPIRGAKNKRGLKCDNCKYNFNTNQ